MLCVFFSWQYVLEDATYVTWLSCFVRMVRCFVNEAAIHIVAGLCYWFVVGAHSCSSVLGTLFVSSTACESIYLTLQSVHVVCLALWLVVRMDCWK